MFSTFDQHKSPWTKLIAAEGESYWMCTEIHVMEIWFLVSFRENYVDENGPAEISRTMLISNFEHVAPIIEQSGEGLFRFKNLQIVTPGRLNGSGEWAMDPIAKVWSAKEPGQSSGEILVYETRTGKKYISALLSTPSEELILGALKFDLSRYSA